MRIGTELPALTSATEWVNGSLEEAMSQIQGLPTLVHFWSVSCGTCKENLPRVIEWREKYREQGLRLIAVHMPRYPADMEVAAVREAIAEHGITEPCAIDNQHHLRDAFLNEKGYVPAYYLFDAQHKLKGFAAGEHGVDVITPALNRMLAVAQEAVAVEV
jgi:thiol-disulfide isomerase/thioredoxin